ncbi:uncharacterized protein LOC143919185 isoform X2 [Arctopsyche grandis]|uniref:uncharacterized protein LOC143919185 isoform X2 n=1 Tax=Arctopsyche grandis TaxID=121162 RepID=UPI00406D8EBC
MSSSLLRRSLQLADAEPRHSGRKKDKKSKGVFDIIPDHHRTVKSVGAGGKIEKRKIYNVSESSSRTRQSKKASSESIVEENLKKLGILGSHSIDSNIANKLVKRAQRGRAVIEIEEEKPEEGTAFTEEDFQKFEREYFCS